MTEKEFSNEFCKYVFDESEKKEIAIEMARKISEQEQLEKDAKSIASEFKAKIDGTKASISGAAIKLNNGYEMRTIKCEVEYDFDKRVIRYVRTDNGEVAKTKNMTSDDLQMRVFQDD